MKKLVFGALLIAVASTGCIISSGSSESVITERWSFTHLADHSPRSCPVGFSTVQVIAQPVDALTLRNHGTTIVDTNIACSDMSTTNSYPDDLYLVWLEVKSDSGGADYTKSEQVLVDTARGDSTISVNILDDGGYFFLTWDLVAKSNQAPLDCASAGVSASGSVETVSTNTADTSKIITDKFTCTDHFGTTSGFVAGRYTVSVDAENGAGALGVTNIAAKDITAPDGLTDLGHVVIPIDGL